MSVTTKIQTTITFSDQTQSMTGSITDTGNSNTYSSKNFAAASTNVVMTMAFTKANLQAFFVVSTQNCVIKTNSSSSPSDTITLVANDPYFWSLSSGLTNPFATNVTTAFVTSTPACLVKMGILQS